MTCTGAQGKRTGEGMHEYQLKMRELENREKEMNACKDGSRNEGELTSIKEKPLQLQFKLKEMEAKTVECPPCSG